MNFHFLFEQSGTFKNVFKGFGHQTFDYDILNQYGQTDFVVDLFKEIENEYFNLTHKGLQHFSNIFDNIYKDDFIIAFFPCTHFCDRNQLAYKLYFGGKRSPFDLRHCENLIKRNKSRAYYFEIYLKFCYICKAKGYKTIIENPASGGKSNYLYMFSPIDVAYKDKDRSLFGDDFQKPTNYFSINFDMVENFEMFSDYNIYTKKILEIRSESISTGGAFKDNPNLCKKFL